jgi:hypothetical protein
MPFHFTVEIMAISSNLPGSIPHDVHNYLLTFLEPRDICLLRRINKNWKIAASSDPLWKTICEQMFARYPHYLPKENYFKFIADHTVRSGSQVLECLDRFIGRISIKQGGTFKCHFDGNPSYELGVSFFSFTAKKPKIKEFFIFRGKFDPDQEIKFRKIDLSNYNGWKSNYNVMKDKRYLIIQTPQIEGYVKTPSFSAHAAHAARAEPHMDLENQSLNLIIEKITTMDRSRTCFSDQRNIMTCFCITLLALGLLSFFVGEVADRASR